MGLGASDFSISAEPRSRGPHALATPIQDAVSPPIRPIAWAPVLLLAPALAVVCLLCLYPLLAMVDLSFRSQYPGTFSYTWGQYAAVFSSSYIRRETVTTFELAFIVTAACAVFAYPVSYHLARDAPRFKNLVIVALTLPLLVNIVVRTIGWTILLGNEGLLNKLLQYLGIIDAPMAMMTSFWSVTAGMVHVLLPFMVISITSVLQKIDRSYEEAAVLHGATSWQAFLYVTLPLSAPGIAAGSVLVFCLTIGAYVTPHWLGRGKVLTLARGIYEQAMAVVDLPGASALAVVLVVASGGVILIFTGLMRQLGPKHR